MSENVVNLIKVFGKHECVKVDLNVSDILQITKLRELEPIVENGEIFYTIEIPATKLRLGLANEQ